MAVVEVSEKSRELSRKAVAIVESLAEKKLGNSEAYGESVVRLRFQGGQLMHVKVTDEIDIK